MAENLRDILGLPTEFKDFPDGKARTIYPATMRDLPKFMEDLGGVNIEKLWANFIFPDSAECLKRIFTVTFKEEADIEEFTGQITPKNFKAIMDTIMAVNGLNISEQNDGDEKNEVEV